MAFSLQGFGAGFASKLTDRIDEERERQEKLQDEARREATQLRLRKQASREAKDKKIEETTGLMKALGFSDTSITTALGQGLGATSLYIEAAKANFGDSEFFDPNVLLETAGPEDTPESISQEIEEQSNTIKKQNDALPDITQGSVLVDPEESIASRSRYLQAAFGKPPKEYASLSAAHAGIVQKMMRERNPAKLAKLEEKEKFILNKIKEVEAEGDGDDTNKFDPNNIPLNRGRYIKQAITTFPDLKYDDITGDIKALKDGQGGLIAIASARAAQDFQTFNNAFETPDVGIEAQVNQDITRAKSDLTNYSNKVARLGREGMPKDPESLTPSVNANFSRYKGIISNQADFAKNIQAGMYGLSDVVVFNNEIYTYVGYDSLLATRQTKVNENGQTVEQIFPFYKSGSM